jgi:hypothetical protein
MTLLQIVEHYTDMLAAETVQNHPDWKYALNFPLAYDGFDPAQLCAFHVYLLGDPNGHRQLLDQIRRLAKIHLFASTPISSPRAVDVVTIVCRINQIILITEVLLQAAEALAAFASIQQEPGFVRLDLYWEYAKTYTALRRTRSPDDVALVEISLGASIGGLLEEVKRLGQSKVEHLPEFHHLRQVWRQHYTPSEASGFRHASKSWQPVDCRDCPLGSQLGY